MKLRNLSDKDQAFLVSLGYTLVDIERIDAAVFKTRYYYPTFAQEIDAMNARTLLGDHVYLSGLARCTFHRTAIRSSNGNHVFFERQSP